MFTAKTKKIHLPYRPFSINLFTFSFYRIHADYNNDIDLQKLINICPPSHRFCVCFIPNISHIQSYPYGTYPTFPSVLPKCDQQPWWCSDFRNTLNIYCHFKDSKRVFSSLRTHIRRTTIKRSLPRPITHWARSLSISIFHVSHSILYKRIFLSMALLYISMG